MPRVGLLRVMGITSSDYMRHARMRSQFIDRVAVQATALEGGFRRQLPWCIAHSIVRAGNSAVRRCVHQLCNVTKCAPVIALSAMSACGALAHATPGPACSEVKWSVPDTLWGPQHTRVYLETPEIVQQGDSLLLIGTFAVMTDSAGLLVVDPEIARAGTTMLAGIRLSVASRSTRSDMSLAAHTQGKERIRRLHIVRMRTRREQQESGSPATGRRARIEPSIGH